MDLILEHGLIRLAANPVSNRKTQGGVTLGSSFVMGASDWLTLAPSDLRRLSFHLCFSINILRPQNSILRLAIKTMTYKTHFCALLLNQLVKVW